MSKATSRLFSDAKNVRDDGEVCFIKSERHVMGYVNGRLETGWDMLLGDVIGRCYWKYRLLSPDKQTLSINLYHNDVIQFQGSYDFS